MEAKQFDIATQVLAGGPTRRRTLGMLCGLGLAGLMGRSASEAKHKKKKEEEAPDRSARVAAFRLTTVSRDVHAELRQPDVWQWRVRRLLWRMRWADDLP